nr:hypothetical protein BaRGS_005414 [Batillaria attramentaria]
MPSVGRMKFPHIEEPGLRDRVQRYFMAIFCFLYFVLGVSVIMCGGLLLARRQLECSYMAQYYSGVCLLLAAGCVTSFFSMCGCLVMRRTNASHYYTPLLLVLIIVLVMEVAAAVSSHILCHIATSGQLEEEMQSARDKFWTSSGSAECLNRLQTDFECCGVWPKSAEPRALKQGMG